MAGGLFRRPFFLSKCTEDPKISTQKRQTNHAKRSQRMYGSQFERLKRDSKELKHYIQKIEQTGNSDLVYKLQKKHEYLSSRIQDMYEELSA